MLISKFDLYKSGWLELVFEKRNKEYGAYQLRQHYAGNMVKAMGIAFFSIALLCAASIVFRAHPDGLKVVLVDNTQVIHLLPPPAPPVKKIEPPAPKPLKAQPPAPAVATIKDVPPEVVVDAKAEKPVKNAELNAAISTETKKGIPGGSNVLPTSDGPGTQPADDESIHNTAGLEAMPEPVGGESAWNKFLSRNLRFPNEAQEAQVSGRVFVSFVIEKDGHLSNIVVLRGAGYGFDEEAVRVLKLAKAWKPGMQNGQPVRVKYIIPINFQFAEN